MSALKGYLCYKMITSQNVSSEARDKNFFIFRKVIFRSEDIQVFVFSIIPVIYQICDVIMNISR